MHKSLNEFEIMPDATTGFQGNRLGTVGKTASSRFLNVFDRNYFILAGNDYEFEIRRDPTMDYGVGCP